MYEFVDVTQPASGNSLPDEALCINGAYIENEIEGYRTLYVTGREVMESEIIDRKIGNIDGTVYQGKRTPARVITVTYCLNGGTPMLFREKFNALNKILSQEEAGLVFHDEPDKYFIGTKSEVGDVEPGRINVTGSFKFYCSDPKKYSAAEKSFSFKPNAAGVLEAAIVNNGTESAVIDYTIEHSHENGYIGIVSEHGAIQLGKKEEVDGEAYKRNEVLVNGYGKFVEDHGPSYENLSNTTLGKMGIVEVGGLNYLGLSGGQATTENAWNGAMRTLTVPADSEGGVGARNWYCYTRHWFETGLMGQTGAQTITFLTGDNQVICAMSINKSDMNGNTASVSWYGPNHKWIRRADFTPSIESGNPYNLYNVGHNDFLKSGETLRIYFKGKYYTYTLPEIKNMVCKKVQIWVGQYGARDLGDQYITRNYFRAIKFQKCNVMKWRDIPNRYQDEDVVQLDGGTTKVYVNGLPRPEDEMIGSTYFKAPPGRTKIRVYHSSFCNPAPVVTAKIREAYL